MKTCVRLFVNIIFPLLLIFSGCDPDFSHTGVNVEFKFYVGNNIKLYEQISLKIQYQNKDIELNYLCGNSGELKLTNFEKGSYIVKALYSPSDERIAEIWGDKFRDITLVNAILPNVKILSDTSITIYLEPVCEGELLFREFYYSGSSLSAIRKYYADQYISIVNNSNKTMNLNDFAICKYTGDATSINPFLEVKDSIVVDQIWQFPFIDTLSYINPGEKIVIAQDAIDHKTDSLGNPFSPVNLSRAQFEFYFDNFEGKDIDTKAANMIELYSWYKGTDMVWHTRNGSALALIRLNSNIKDYINKHLLAIEKASGKYQYNVVIPESWIIDGFETLRSPADISYKRLRPTVDAGFTYIENGSGSGLCIRRKTYHDNFGNQKFIDTNNSSDDFLHDVTPKPFENE